MRPRLFIHSMLVFQWLLFTLTQCLFFIDHSLHPRLFRLRVSRSCIACFPIVTLMILSTAEWICQLHPPDSSPVNAIYYNIMTQDQRGKNGVKKHEILLPCLPLKSCLLPELEYCRSSQETFNFIIFYDFQSFYH